MTSATTSAAAAHRAVIDWYAANRRGLPWRTPETSPWQVMVSEFMLQQTPVTRVLPVYEAWVREWPGPEDLAAATTGDAIRAWGRLGYPRRALRLHACAVAITEDHGGVVPSTLEELRALPGVGDYTAAAVATFAYGQRHAVLDTNVRRVLGRFADGEQYPGKSVSAAERRLAELLLPEADADAAAWSIGLMEIGAIRCRPTAPLCGSCPLAADCRWRLAGHPPQADPVRRTQTYAGTDRQCRGRLLAVLRDSATPVHRTALDIVWDNAPQRHRALDSLVADGLVEPMDDELFRLPET